MLPDSERRRGGDLKGGASDERSLAVFILIKKEINV
jgi:hypothetical protein